MPAFASHYIFAKEMMPFLKETADFETNESAVYFGAQGPDIFFFHRVFPWMPGKSLRKYGSILHRTKPETIFESMRAYCKTSGNCSIVKSYVYGFILHYALDRNCHPYVYYLQNEMTKKHKLTNPHTAHNTIESAMDTYLLNKRLSVKEPEKFRTADTLVYDKNVMREIGIFLKDIIAGTLGKKMTQKQGYTALEDTGRIQKVLYDPFGIKRLLIRPVETVIAPFSRNFKFTAMLRPKDLEKAKKYANIENNEWESPYSSGVRKESFEALFELSKKDAREMILSFQAGKDCRAITQNKSFLTGVEIQ